MKVNYEVYEDAVVSERWIKEIGEDKWIDVRQSTFEKIESLQFDFESKPSKGEVICLFAWDEFDFTTDEYRFVESHVFEVYDIWYFPKYISIILNIRN